ncbi:MAG: flavodoxin family protein [Anaerolineae bacterium]|nr:flavodoxin family protein [Anaerolineae bacterium]
MKALVIYDSVFGNTEKVAQTMGEALGSQVDALVLKVTDVQPEQLAGLSYLIVGSPTRAFSPTPAIKDFLKGIPSGSLTGVKVAAFDTRIAVAETNSAILSFLVKIFGYAAEPIAKKLQRKGGAQGVTPEGFFVKDSEGPLKDGELDRAAAWATQILM